MSGRLSFGLRFAAIPLLCGLLYLSEARGLFPAGRLFTFIFVFLLLAAVASLLRGAWRDCLLVAASLALGISLFEGAAMRLEPKPAVASTAGWFGSRPVVGWGPDHAGRFHAEKTDLATRAKIYNVDYTIDSNLLRQTQSCEAGRTIVFFGCSFVFGEGLNDADTLPQAFADSLDRKRRVLNMGLSGYGPQQVLRLLQSGLSDAAIGPEPVLFVFMTGAWHAERLACKPYFVRFAPRLVSENGQIALKGACYEGTRLQLRDWLEGSAVYRLFVEPYLNRLSRDDVAFYISVVLETARLAKEKYGVPMLLPYIRSSDGYLAGTGFDDDAIIKRFQDGGAYVVDVSLEREEAGGAVISIKGDGHPTAFANRLRATLIKDYIEQRMPGILTPRRDSNLD
jgi:hypothetical protein